MVLGLAGGYVVAEGRRRRNVWTGSYSNVRVLERLLWDLALKSWGSCETLNQPSEYNLLSLCYSDPTSTSDIASVIVQVVLVDWRRRRSQLYQVVSRVYLVLGHDLTRERSALSMGEITISK